ncbi:hypothetical protein [Halomicrococcus sp. SG-WS-1]|uniref:hypothetical protein n=1 Tax=Halomicrococcus sp. SG-WS-1 TaxID=3439057 RepID=UPI003F7AF377
MSERVGRGERRGPEAALAVGLTVSVVFVAVVALYWTLFGLATFGIPGLYALPGGVLVVQFARSLRMDDWPRRGAALASVGGFLVLIAGLRPMGSCVGSAQSQCSASLNPVVPVLALGVLLTTATLAYDLHRRRR